MQAAQIEQLVGKKLGAYQIEHLLGHGQLSAVYMARQSGQAGIQGSIQGRTVLMTIFHYPEVFSAQERRRLNGSFEHEGAALVRLHHPNILPTYDFGEQAGYPYLVTAFAQGASLAQLVKQQKRLSPEQTLSILQQLADGLDYAHRNSVTHGVLSLSNVLVNDDFTVQIAGFGLKIMLEAHRDRQGSHPQAHLLSAAGTFLGSPDYIAPERVQGLPAGWQADIYALGVMLFELLGGVPPFHGATPLETTLQRMRQSAPLLHAICPDISEGFDLVIGKALEIDPERRYQKAGDVAIAYERVLKALAVTQSTLSVSSSRSVQVEQQITLPSTGNLRVEGSQPLSKWQLMPPIVTAQMPSVSPTAPADTDPRREVPGQPALPSRPLPDTDHPAAVQPAHAGLEFDARKMPTVGDSLVGMDPFAWWTATTQGLPQEPGTFSATTQGRRSPVRLANMRGRRKPVRQDRRQVVKLIATGSAVAGVFAVGGISFARFVQSVKQAQQLANAPVTGPTTITRGNTPSTGATRAPQQSPTAAKTASPKPSPTHVSQPTPTAQPTQQPTSQPTPKPTQPPPPPTPTPSHTGTVIGHTNQATNSAITFTNPADGQSSLLIHLPNGNFVACERACTHAGVPVDYQSGQQQLYCPAHGAIFDPLNGFAHTSGPGNGPLGTVNIRVNGDGTITTG